MPDISQIKTPDNTTYDLASISVNAINVTLTKRTITELRSSLNSILNEKGANKYLVVYITSLPNNWVNFWNDENVETELPAGSRVTFHHIGLYTNSNYSTWLVTSYGDNYNYIIVKNNGVWSRVRKLVLEDYLPTKLSQFTNDLVMPVANGGTGATTFREHSLLLGNTTNSILSSELSTYDLVINPGTAPAVGWRRICRFTFNLGYNNFIIFIHGSWSSGAPTNAILNVSIVNKTASVSVLSCGYTGVISYIRVSNISGTHEWYLDAYLDFITTGTVGTQRFNLFGDVKVLETFEKNPSPVVTDVGTNIATSAYLETARGPYLGKYDPAVSLATKRTIDGIQFDGSSNISHYGTCSTAAATVAKVATVDSSFVLEPGAMVNIKMQYANGVATPTLNVNGTGDIAIKRYGTTAPSTTAASSWNANSIVQFIYDGTYWYIQGWLNNYTDTKVTQTDTNTDASYRILLSENDTDTTQTVTARKSKKFKANPNTGVLTASIFEGNLKAFVADIEERINLGTDGAYISSNLKGDGNIHLNLGQDNGKISVKEIIDSLNSYGTILENISSAYGDSLFANGGLTIGKKIYIYKTGDNDLGIRFTKDDGSYKYWVFYKDTDMLKISGTSIFRWKSTVGKMLTGKTTSVDISEYPDASEFLIIAHPGTATSITYSILVPKVALSATAQLFRSGHYQNGSNGGMVTYSCTSSTISMDNVFLNSSDVSSSSTWTVYWR